MDTNLQPIYAGIIEGEMAVVGEHVQKALDAGLAPEAILQQGLVPAMNEVGQLFEKGEYFVPEMLLAARAMQAGLAILKPHLVNSNHQAAGRVVLGTVQGDLHDIGKNLVGMMLEGAGFEIIDLGTDVQPDRFVEAVQANRPDLVGMSALLTTTMPSMKATLEALQSAGLRDQVKVMIGGAPVTDTYADDIGADGYAGDASRAVRLAQTLIATRQAA
jgi:5-methyltetrahydrofolate--homocysteine methyltransferase